MNFPPSFDEYLGFLSVDDRKDLLEALDAPPILSIRVNQSKWEGEVPYHKVPWASSGYYMEERPLFNSDPLWHAGAYYVQEASSMFVGYIMRRLKKSFDCPVRVLDLCGAPGGKTTDIASELEHDDLLVSNEVIQSRAGTLLQNCVRWGKMRHEVTNSDPQEFGRIPGFFDVVVVDAPCSGEGMFRKDPAARQEWSVESVKLCHARQQRILHDVWDALKEGGYLVYCTCTFNEVENELTLKEFARSNDFRLLAFDEVIDMGLSKSEQGFYRCLPSKLAGEGFSFCVIQKQEPAPSIRRKKSATLKLPKKLTAFGLPLQIEDDALFPALQDDDWQGLTKLNRWKSGMQVGAMKRDKVIPAHRLSQLVGADNTDLEKVELEYHEAIRLLRKEPLSIASSKGYKVLAYRGVNLAVVNHLGNRSNSLYPPNLRIRSQAVFERDPGILPGS